MFKKLKYAFVVCVNGSIALSSAGAEKITIATVNNGDMIRMQKLTGEFTKKYPNIQVEWVTLEENILRQRVTTDIATKGGSMILLPLVHTKFPYGGARGGYNP